MTLGCETTFGSGLECSSRIHNTNLFHLDCLETLARRLDEHFQQEKIHSCDLSIFTDLIILFLDLFRTRTC